MSSAGLFCSPITQNKPTFKAAICGGGGCGVCAYAFSYQVKSKSKKNWEKLLETMRNKLVSGHGQMFHCCLLEQQEVWRAGFLALRKWSKNEMISLYLKLASFYLQFASRTMLSIQAAESHWNNLVQAPHPSKFCSPGTVVRTCLQLCQSNPKQAHWFVCKTSKCVQDQKPRTPVSNPESCLSNAEWVHNREYSQESRMMSIQQADVLQCLGRRFNAYESLSQILLLSRRAKKQLFS